MERRVFLVDDLVTMRTLIEELLSMIEGLRLVATSKSEAEAKLWIDDHPGAWDLAIVDLVLDQGAGMTVIRHARAAHPHGKIVVFSGFATPAISSHCLSLGADAVFDKTRSREFLEWLYEHAGPSDPGMGS